MCRMKRGAVGVGCTCWTALAGYIFVHRFDEDRIQDCFVESVYIYTWCDTIFYGSFIRGVMLDGSICRYCITSVMVLDIWDIWRKNQEFLASDSIENHPPTTTQSTWYTPYAAANVPTTTPKRTEKV